MCLTISQFHVICMSARNDPHPHKVLQICADSGEGGKLTDLTWHPGLMYARPSEGTEAIESDTVGRRGGGGGERSEAAASRLARVLKVITLLSGCFL